MTTYSEVATVSNQVEKFLPVVRNELSFLGGTQYFLYYLTNTSGANVDSVSVTLEVDTPGADTLAIAKVPTIDTDGEAGSASGYSYSGVGAPVTLGDIPSGSRWGVWVRRVIPEESALEVNNTFRLKIDTAASIAYASGEYEIETPSLPANLSLSESVSTRISVVVSEGVAMGDPSGAWPHVEVSVSETVSLAEQGVTTIFISVEESVNATTIYGSAESLPIGVEFDDAVATGVIYIADVAEGISLGDAVISLRVVPVSFSEGINLADTFRSLGVHAVLLDESLLLSDAARVNEILSAYVYNTVNTAVSTYKGYNFNSFALIGGKYYGADLDGGVYELAGADDAGAPIDAVMTLPTDDLSLRAQNGVVGAGKLKRCEVAYLGYRADGGMFLRVDANGGSNVYSIVPNATPGMRTGRILLGKGVSSRYWDFTLGNLLGADFEIGSATFVPVVLGRRITEY